MMITPLGTGAGCHVRVMVVKVLLNDFNPPTGPGAGGEEDQEDGHARSEYQCMVSYVTYNNLYFVQSNNT